MLPEWTAQEMSESGMAVTHKKYLDLLYDLLGFASYHKGRSLRRLQIGNYEDEVPSLVELHHSTMSTKGLDFNGCQHEI